jgi:predicted nucleic acid-binding protein
LHAWVFDSHGLLAYLRDEPGAAEVEQLLVKAAETNRPVLMTEANYAEVKYIILRKDGAVAWQRIAESLSSLPVQFVAIDRSLADLAADFKAHNRLSLADAFAAALAKLRKAELVTGDPELKAMEGEIKLRWLR